LKKTTVFKGGDKASPELSDGVKKAMTEAKKLGGHSARTQRPHWRKGLHWQVPSISMLLAIGVSYFTFGHSALNVPAEYGAAANHVALACIFIAVIFAIQKAIDYVLLFRSHDQTATLFNLRLVVRLVAIVLVVLIILSALSQTWYTVPIVLGVTSVLVGFALQTPMTSFVGWVYIVLRVPYTVGDRIKVAGATGDVIDVSYFDTTLWEFGGQYLSTDHPSGRIIKFPNSMVLDTAVFNYSWPLFPYIWDEIKFNVAYNSDLDFVAGIMTATANEELGEVMAERIRAYRSVLEKTPIDQLEVREEPTVFFRVNENGWLDAIVRYLVDPKESGRMKTVLIRKMLLRLNEDPDRVLFPKGAAR
jgi:small-conductance mechanosensitive channel